MAIALLANRSRYSKRVTGFEAYLPTEMPSLPASASRVGILLGENSVWQMYECGRVKESIIFLGTYQLWELRASAVLSNNFPINWITVENWGSVDVEEVGWSSTDSSRDRTCVLPLVDQPGAKVSQKGINFLQCLMVINGRLMRLALFKRWAKWPLRKSLVRVILTIVRCSPGDFANGTNKAVTIEGGSRLTRRWSLPLPFFSNRREIHLKPRIPTLPESSILRQCQGCYGMDWLPSRP